jgi:2-polyprenyl-3-methyl-5-hydroxy-6-metoxy-1,4-benzoquinol methylase
MMMEEILHIVKCPKCGSALVTISSKQSCLLCKKCDPMYTFRDGIIDFIGEGELEEIKSVNAEYHDMEADYYDNIHLHMQADSKLFKEIVVKLDAYGKTILDVGTGTGFVLDNKENPNWYNDNQIKYADEGPYRHHLRKRVEYLFSVFNRYSFNSPKILDAGCGDGINLRHLVTIADSTVFGIDYNLIRLFRAQVNCDGKAFLVLGSLLERVFREEYFDIILCNHVLEHIEDDLAILLNLHRMLKPNGILILGVPNEGAFLWRLNYRLIQPNIMETTDHVHFYIVKDIQVLLDKSNFVLEEVKHMGWGVPHTGIDARLRQYKWIDDLFDVGRWLCKSQATSLYFICRKGI